MAHYVRYEIYIPVHYSVNEPSTDPTDRRMIRYSLDTKLVSDFTKEAVKRFGGATQAHPAEGPPFRGWWWSNDNKQLFADDVTYFFVLVPLDLTDEAESFFRRWKTRLERNLNQEVILIKHWNVQTVGGFL